MTCVIWVKKVKRDRLQGKTINLNIVLIANSCFCNKIKKLNFPKIKFKKISVSFYVFNQGLVFLDFSSGSHKKYETWRKDKWNGKLHDGLKKSLWNKIVLPLLPLVIQREIQCNWRSTNGKCDKESVVRTMNEFIEVATMIRYLRLGN